MARDIQDTSREAFIRIATAQFADKGFYGVSIAAIAAELGLTKQALLHHFGSKERLYGEVLQGISDRMTQALVDGQEDDMAPEQRLEVFFAQLCEMALQDNTDLRLIERELLDNRKRADDAGRWYLKPFLQELTAMVRDTAAWRGATEGEAFIAAYQVLGAISYFSISESTLRGIYGEEHLGRLQERFPEHIRKIMYNLLQTHQN